MTTCNTTAVPLLAVLSLAVPLLAVLSLAVSLLEVTLLTVMIACFISLHEVLLLVAQWLAACSIP